MTFLQSTFYFASLHFCIGNILYLYINLLSGIFTIEEGYKGSGKYRHLPFLLKACHTIGDFIRH